MNKSISVLYHANCTDGFMASFVHWLFSKLTGEPALEYIAHQYGTPVPSFKGDKVIILDYSFDPNQLEQTAFAGKVITILDHHKTAADTYGGYGTYYGDCCGGKSTFSALFTQDMSGAGLAYDYCLSLYMLKHDLKKPVWLDRLKFLVDRVQYRDLWEFKLMYTSAVYELLRKTDNTFETWEKILLQDEQTFQTALQDQNTRVEMRDELTKQYASKAMIVPYDESTLAIVNCTSDFSSGVGSVLSEKHVFAVMFVLSPTQKLCICSLRSKAGSTDVSKIALSFGGGGHVNASGFSFNYLAEPEKLFGVLDGSLFNNRT